MNVLENKGKFVTRVLDLREIALWRNDLRFNGLLVWCQNTQKSIVSKHFTAVALDKDRNLVYIDSLNKTQKPIKFNNAFDLMRQIGKCDQFQIFSVWDRGQYTNDPESIFDIGEFAKFSVDMRLAKIRKRLQRLKFESMTPEKIFMIEYLIRVHKYAFTPLTGREKDLSLIAAYWRRFTNVTTRICEHANIDVTVFRTILGHFQNVPSKFDLKSTVTMLPWYDDSTLESKSKFWNRRLKKQTAPQISKPNTSPQKAKNQKRKRNKNGYQ